MLGGELMFHFMNVMVMTLVVAPLVLWRYRRAVLAGMRHRLGAPLPVPAAPLTTVIQVTLLVAVHEHSLEACTNTVPVPPAASNA